MNDKVDFKYLLEDSRSRVYLVWTVIVAIGYTATHYYQNKNINFVWFVLASCGFYFMYRVMPLRVNQMRHIFAAWLVPISFGLAISIVSARGWALPDLLGYLGVFWLLVTSVGFIWNGLVDRPAAWYFIGAIMCIVAAAACYLNDVLLSAQYLVAGVVSTWAMLNLVIFRADSL